MFEVSIKAKNFSSTVTSFIPGVFTGGNIVPGEATVIDVGEYEKWTVQASDRYRKRG